jgi:hypothetical protein
LAKNTKTKIRSTLKKYGVDLSSEVELPSIESFETRDQFNEWKNKQSSFTNKANTRYQFKMNVNGVVATKFELNQAEKNHKIDVRNAEKERKKVERLAKQGNVTAITTLMMKQPSNVRIPKPTPFNFNNFHTRKGLEDRFQKLEERANGVYYDKRLQQMKNNWLDSVAGSFNSDADDIIDRIKWMPADDFYELYEMFKSVMSFEMYDSKGQMVDANENHLNRIRHYLDEYERGDLEFDLKNVPNRS